MAREARHGPARRSIEFRIDGALAPKGSLRGFGFRRRDGGIGVGMTNDNPSTAETQARIGWAAKSAIVAAGGELLEGALSVAINVYVARPPSVSAARRSWPCVRPDLDKLARAALDGLTRIAFRDDGQVCALRICKRYAAGPPYAEFMIAELE
jgi:Holliday junction resolvase RusA-like endonuclease